MRTRISLDRGWKFSLGHFCDPDSDFDYGGGDLASSTKTGDGAGAVRRDFDDRGWTSIDLPHDWAVELPCVKTADPYYGYRPLGRQFPETSVGWYRRELEISSEITSVNEGARLHVVFDGVFRDSIVWLNGHYLGRHLSGYTGFRYDITDYVDYAGKNVLVVRVDATHFEGWFYEGAGIYRHVWLEKMGSLNLSPDGVAVRSVLDDDQKPSAARISVEAEIENATDHKTDFHLDVRIADKNGAVVTEGRSSQGSVSARQMGSVSMDLPLKEPHLWSMEEPYLYTVTCVLLENDKEVDAKEIPFGIRSIRFDADSGFYLNGRHELLKGVCCHQDAAGVGVAVPDNLWAYRIRKLKEMGCNAYRCAHNPPAPELLDVCDRLGMLVIDENRIMGSSGEVLDQLTRMVKRDRNHPSIILWALGNEEHIIQGSAAGERIVLAMKRTTGALDPTRQVTAAMNGDWGSAFSLATDVHGCNYIACGDVDEFHAVNPGHPIVATETASTLCTRGVYGDVPELGYGNSYGTNLPSWGAGPEDMWQYWVSRPNVAGVFVWTGFDYRGEPLPYNWPCVNSNFGVMDLCGFPKDSYYYYQSWWTDRQILHLFPHWNWGGREGEPIEVRCYGNSTEVELFLNGKSLGRKPMERNSQLAWTVPYEPGRLEAKGYSDGLETMHTVRETTGQPVKIVLSSDIKGIQAEKGDVAIVNVSLVDERGRIVHAADNEVRFCISGGGTIRGVANGDPSFHDPERAETCRAFNGRCQIVVEPDRGSNTVVVEATSPGLVTCTIAIETSGE